MVQLTSLSLSLITMMSGQYVQPLDQAEWQVYQSPFSCSLEQTISAVGKARFVAESGRSLVLSFSATSLSAPLSHASVKLALSPLRERNDRDVYFYEQEAFSYEEKEALFSLQPVNLVEQIEIGEGVIFSIKSGERTKSVEFPSIYGSTSVDSFRKCVQAMSPLSWEQARDSEFFFSKGKVSLSKKNIAMINKLARYLKFDPEVKRILVDGHSDDAGSGIANRMLSQERADEIGELLMQAGVDAKKIEIRAHGNRYPRAIKAHSEHYSNSRATVRLVRKSS